MHGLMRAHVKGYSTETFTGKGMEREDERFDGIRSDLHEYLYRAKCRQPRSLESPMVRRKGGGWATVN